MSFSIILSVGKYGGFNLHTVRGKHTGGIERRICCGWVAVSLLTPEFDQFLDNIMESFKVRIEEAKADIIRRYCL